MTTPTSNPKQAYLDLAIRDVEGHLATGTTFAATRSYNHQVVRGLAYLYTLAGSPFRGDARIAQAIRDVVKAIAGAAEHPDNRLTGHLADAKRILDAAGLADLSKDMAASILAGAEVLAKDLQNLRLLTHFTSGNCGTSTNHVAVYGASLYRAGEVLGRDDFRVLARDHWDRLVRDQHPDGFWAETTPGPATTYNHLTVCCAGRMWRYTGHESFRQAALRGASFHERFSYPDACDLETIDGRVRYRGLPKLWLGFVLSLTPSGRALARRQIEICFKRTKAGSMGSHLGESIALCCESHEYWTEGPAGEALVDRPSYVETFSDLPAGVRKEGPWFLSFQGIAHLSRGWGGFTIDRTGLFSLWHANTGLIVNGSGEPDPNPGQTFRFRLKWDKNAPPVPERARVEMGRAGSKEPAVLHAEYRGGTARLEARAVSDREVRLTARVGARLDYYPIEFTLPLELHDGDRVNGTVLGAETPVALDAAALKGCIDAGKFRIEFPPEGAAFRWPHNPYNPYNKTTYKSGPDKFVGLLTLPVGPDGVEVVFCIPD